MTTLANAIGQSNEIGPFAPEWEEHPCAHCRCVILVSAHTPETPVCVRCRREHADQDLHELEGLLKALRQGTEPFDIYTKRERDEHLARLSLLHRCFPEASKAMSRTHALPETVRFETPTAADVDAMLATEEMLEA